jgi:hypothetical protein
VGSSSTESSGRFILFRYTVFLIIDELKVFYNRNIHEESKVRESSATVDCDVGKKHKL